MPNKKISQYKSKRKKKYLKTKPHVTLDTDFMKPIDFITILKTFTLAKNMHVSYYMSR